MQERSLASAVEVNNLKTLTAALKRLEDYGPAATLLAILNSEDPDAPQYTFFGPSDEAFAAFAALDAFTNQGIYEVSLRFVLSVFRMLISCMHRRSNLQFLKFFREVETSPCDDRTMHAAGVAGTDSGGKLLV